MGSECSSPCVQEEKWRLISCMYVAWTINPLQQGYHYSGPSGIDDGNLCLCNTVVYSLLSACDACQSETWITYIFIVSFSSPAPLCICHQVVRIYVQLHKDTTSLEVSFPLRPRIYRIALTGNWPIASLTRSLQEHIYLRGLSSTLPFVVIMFSSFLTHTNSTT